ncbi:MAG: acyltransferase domain-containing protein [Trichlorobacter sp.]|jgi:malonyl CoA-acyl carrier protein transacylase
MLWIFPGQPLHRESPLPDDDDFLAIARLCRERCGYDLVSHQALSAHGLSPHTMLQVYGVAMSLYRSRKLRHDGLHPDLIAEHSLGVYAALAACDSIGEGDALELVCRIGSSMAGMGQRQPYALGCPIGIDRGVVEQAAAEAGVFVANYNTSGHFLLAGVATGIEAALAACQAAGAFSVSQFPCEAPLHTPLMAELAGELAAIVADYCFQEPAIPLLEHIGQTRLSAAIIPAFLVTELQQPVYWEQTWQTVRTIGFNRCIEVGSGQALTKFNRWIDSEVCR